MDLPFGWMFPRVHLLSLFFAVVRLNRCNSVIRWDYVSPSGDHLVSTAVLYQREGVAHPQMPFGRVKPSTQGSWSLSKNMKAHYLKSTAHAPVMKFSICGWSFFITNKLSECKQLLSRLAHGRTAKGSSVLTPVRRNDLCRLAGNTRQKIKIVPIHKQNFGTSEFPIQK